MPLQSSIGNRGAGDPTHLHALTSTSGGHTYAYDAAGNATCRARSSTTTCTGGSQTGNDLTYGREGELMQWQATPGSTTSTDGFVYDGEGTRVEQTLTQNGTTTTWVDVGSLAEHKMVGSNTSLVACCR